MTRKHLLFMAFPLLLANCSEPAKTVKKKPTVQPVVFTEVEEPEEVVKPDPYCDTLEIIMDSVSFGRKGRTKLELRKIGTDTSSFANLKLFSLRSGKWKLTDELSVPASLFPSDPIFQDYNRDGFKDLLFHSAEAARGANNVQTMVLFDPGKNKLIWIRNSERFPNMEYNKLLHCIDALSVYNGTTTHFLKLKGDSLVPFAEVDHMDGRIRVKTIAANGTEKVIENIPDEGYSGFRFRNYNPLME